ncbi:hypothetical protein Dimus_008603, partial [Dionaea muscipula]
MKKWRWPSTGGLWLLEPARRAPRQSEPWQSEPWQEQCSPEPGRLRGRRSPSRAGGLPSWWRSLLEPSSPVRSGPRQSSSSRAVVDVDEDHRAGVGGFPIGAGHPRAEQSRQS